MNEERSYTLEQEGQESGKGTFYTHCVVSYASYEEIQPILASAKHWAYIYHDKDIKPNGEPRDPHFHILCTFANAKSYNSVRKLVQSKQNTFTKCVISKIGNVLTYFLHATDTAIKQGKQPYSEEDVEYDDESYWRKQSLSNGEPWKGEEFEKEKYSNAEFMDDLLSVNFSVEAMGRKYGRDFIKNYRSYQAYRDRCLWERQKQAVRESDEFKDFESAKKVQYFKLTEDGELVPVFEDYLFKGRE